MGFIDSYVAADPPAGEEMSGNQDAPSPDLAAVKSLGDKFKAVFDGLNEEERKALSTLRVPAPEDFAGDDWVELPHGAAQSMTDQLAAFAQDFGSLAAGVEGMFGFPELDPGAAFPRMPFAPAGGEEAFTLDGERDTRAVEAANGYADTLEARLHADANERERKLGLFKAVAAGGLYWLLEKIEGVPTPLPREPIGPAVNGSRRRQAPGTESF
jgi:hypothetical protein